MNQVGTRCREETALGAFQVMKELQSALSTAAADDSKLVLLSAVGSVFCCGLDFISHHPAPDGRPQAGERQDGRGHQVRTLSTGGLAEPDPAAGGLSSLENGRGHQVPPCPREGRLSRTLLLGSPPLR